MVLQAKDALGRIPTINEDLLDINASYFKLGTIFWVSVDNTDSNWSCGGRGQH